MKKILVVFTALFMLNAMYAQDTIPSNWKIKAIGSITGTQASFQNWNAGGQNTISWIAIFDGTANWKKDNMRWQNSLKLAYGQNKITTDPWSKTDDQINASSKFGYEIKKKLDIALLGDFKTQFDLGYDGEGNFSSKFMAPGYLTLALGLDYNPSDNFQMLASPFTGKFTFVQDYSLFNAGAFGIDPEVNTRMIRPELGAYIKTYYSREIMKNVNFKGKLELFSNYLNNPQNIDVNLETLFNFKINDWLTASWSFALIYDDDIDISVYDSNGNLTGVGPRAQIKNVIGIGLGYTFIDKK